MARPNNFTYFTRKSLIFAEECTATKKREDEEGVEPNNDLEAGKQLPFFYGNIPTGMMSEPLEDLDPYYLDKNTFIVLNKRKTIFRFNASPALYILTPFHMIRRISIKILVNCLFNMILMGTFLFNCVFLTNLNPPNWIFYFELSFIGLYTFEIFIKILARGFCIGPFTLLRDPWNWFYIHILAYAYLRIFVNLESIPALGIFSLLRILKAISLTTGTRIIIGTLTRSAKMFCHTVILTMFCLSVFAVMGMQLFMGSLKHKCLPWPQEEGNMTEIMLDNERFDSFLLERGMNAFLCGNSTFAGQCPEGYLCVKTGINPDYGYTNFDNFGWAFLSLFRLMTLDFWESLYQQTLRAVGKTYIIFFVIVIFFCSFYLVTLKLAVVAMGYEKQNRATIRAAKRRQVKYQAMLYQREREQEATEATSAFGEDEKKKVAKDQSYSETSNGISDLTDERIEQRKKGNQKKQADGEEKEIDAKLHQFESEDYIRKKISHHIKNSQKKLHEKKSFTQERNTMQVDKKERQIKTCQVSVDILEDPTVRKRTISRTMKEFNKCRPRSWWKRFAKMFLIWNCCPFWIKCKDFVHNIVMDPFFDLGIVICVIINLIFLAMDHYPMTEEFLYVLFVGHQVFTGIYVLEMILKIIALHPYNYFQEKWNIFDTFIVILALGELVISSFWITDTVHISLLQFLFLLRGLRVFKLTKYWPMMKMMIKIIGYSVKTLRSLTLVLVITIFIFAVVGLQFFGHSYKNNACKIDTDCLLPRWHMHHIFNSFLIVIRALYGEWIETMWDCMEVAGQSMCLVFYMGIIVIGNLLVLILFVALLSSFISENSAVSDVKADSQNLYLAMTRIKKRVQYVKRTLFDLIAETFTKNQTTSKETKRIENLSMEKKNDTSSQSVNKISNDQDFQNGKQGTIASGSSMEKYMKDNSSSQSSICNPNLPMTAPIALTEFDSDNVNTKEFSNEFNVDDSNEKLSQAISPEDSMAPILGLQEEQSMAEHVKSKEPEPCFSNSCRQMFPFCGASKKSKVGKIWWNLRKTCYWIVKHHWFEMFMLLIILLNCASLTFEDINLQKRKTIMITLEYADKIFTYLFIAEMLLKWMACGCKTYFSNPWCWLEFLVVNVCFINLLTNYLGYAGFVSLKSLRSLRILSAFERVRVVVTTLLKEIPSILKVLLVCLTFWLIFSIIGVNLFAGKFSECVNTTDFSRFPETIVQNKSECEMLMYTSKDMILGKINEDVQWKNAKMNFDNVGNGYFSLFQVDEGMYSAVDSSDVGSQPKYNSKPYMHLYFVSFIIFGVFFPLVLFIGVIIDHFKQQKKIRGHSTFMTEKQNKYYNSMKQLRYKKPIPRPGNKFQGYVFDLVTKDAFEITILVLICVNMIIMMVETDTESVHKAGILYYINLVFIGLFAGECVLKLIGLRHYYFTVGWNIFDFVVVHISIAVILLSHWHTYFLTYGQMQAIRLMRCGRVLNFIKGTKGIGTLISAMILSLPALLNIVLLFFLIMIIYAIIGMSQFAYVKKDAGINDMFNFETFGNSIFCLFQITTFAGWDGLIAPILNTGPPDCDPEKLRPGISLKGDCGSPIFGIFYFVSFLIISFLLLVNMFIIVILEIFNAVKEENAKSLSEEAFDNFYEVWQKFDPDTTHFIDYNQLSNFVASLDPPLHVAKPNKSHLMAMDLPIARGDRVFCPDVLFALAKHVVGESEEFDHLHLPMREQFLSSCLFQISYEPVTTIKQKQEEISVPVIQNALGGNISGTNNRKDGDREDPIIKDNIILD
ncbi:sodium channel protein type 9 subunit alpha-like [Sminthopsis crassicaudata]|uniref:sodium channel protein type 9 subunit alpha-like n=1 Tax=Sminthopsis crassicaudata TaxID=9301 RepID=UPI003D682DA2